jgi:hypothetical protein
VRGAAVGALGRLVAEDKLASAAAGRRPAERDPDVVAEWTAALR